MKKKSLLIILLIAAVAAAMLFTACSKSAAMTLERYMEEHPDVRESALNAAEQTDGLVIDIIDNTVYYYFDLGSLGFTSDSIAHGAKEALDSALEDNKATFAQSCKTLEDQVGIEDLHMSINYLWEDEVISSRDFTAGDME